MSKYVNKIMLSNKLSFVTGGLGLIGSETVNALSEAGSKVVIFELDQEIKKNRKIIEENSKKGDIVYESFNIAELDTLDERFDEMVFRHGVPDVFINNAYPRTDDWGDAVEDLKLSSLRINVDMHLNSYMWLSRKACLTMKKNGGSVINFGSIYGVLGNDFTVYDGTSMTSPMAYSAIKGGIINLSRYLASYFGRYNIRVNNICPGGVINGQNETFVSNYCHKTPLKRMASPEEIAGAVLFLACDLSSYVTGQTILVDGGWSIV